MTKQMSAGPVRPMKKHGDASECESNGGLGVEQLRELNDTWVIERKYVGGMDDDDDEVKDWEGDPEHLFGSSDEDRESEDFFQGVNFEESEDECG